MTGLLTRRRAAHLAALTVVTAGLPTLVDAAYVAASAVVAPVLKWEVSAYYDEHTSVHELSGGATENADGVITFPNGVGGRDRATGVTSMAYEGTVTASFELAPTQRFYSITITDPVVAVDDAGHGTVTAVVSASNVAQGETPAESTSPTRVLVTTFDAAPGSWTQGPAYDVLDAVPHWPGVLPPGSPQAQALGIPAGQPVDGKAFAPEFLGQVTSGVRALFYASGSGSDLKKAPARIVAQAPGSGVPPGPPPEPADTLAWEVSESFDDVLSAHTLAGGATEDDDGIVSFPRGEGTYDSETGVAAVTYTGSVTGTATGSALPVPGLPLPPSELFTVTIADPVVSTDLAGAGEVTAVVSSSKPTDLNGPAASTPPTRVRVTSFSAGVDPWVDGPTTRGSLSTVPPAFDPAFLDQIVAEARSSFHSGGTATDPATTPAGLVAGATMAPVLQPATVVTTTVSSPSAGLGLHVEGTGFRGVTRQGDDGVNVGLAPSGGLPDVSTPAGLAQFAAVEHVPASAVVDRAFEVDLHTEAADLDPARTYSVYTWQAPSRSTTTQDTATAVAIDFVALGLVPAPAPPAVAVSTQNATPVGGLALRVAGSGFRAVTNAGDQGVYIGLAESGGLPDVSTFDLSRFAAAEWVMPGQMPGGAFSRTLTAPVSALDPTRSYSVYTWQAHTHSNTTQDTETPVTIDWVALGLASAGGPSGGKAVPTLSGDWARLPTATERGRLTVSAGGPSGPAAGQVLVTLSRHGVKHRLVAVLADGSCRVRLPKLGPGRWKVKLKYAGDVRYVATRTLLRVTVR